MNSNQMVIGDAQSFKSRDGRECYVFQCFSHDGYGKMKATTTFCDGVVFGQYSGPGLYDVTMAPYVDREGNQRARLAGVKKVKGLEF